MTEHDEAEVSGIGRYVPLLVYAVVILTFLFIPLKIVSYGYLPADDALRHAAKAVSGKPWPEILVLGPDYKVDHNFGWHLFLRQIYLAAHCGTESLVVVSVVLLFTLVCWSGVPWLKRPETWLAAILIMMLTSGVFGRLLLGRPFVLTIFSLITILFAWQTRGPAPPGWKMAVMMMGLIALAIFVHGVWYLWVLPVAAFVLAKQYRWAMVLGGSWVAGTLLAVTLTGHPIDSLTSAVFMASKAFSAHLAARTQVTEFQPIGGEFPSLVVIGGLILLRVVGKLPVRPLSESPVFWLVCMGWLLGFKASRFWTDWGWPALLVQIAFDLQAFLVVHLGAVSFRRLGLTCGLAAATYLAATNDNGSRWSSALSTSYLEASNPELEGWLPDEGGILYSGEMAVFYDTFFKNPNGNWRYILGYEPVIMPPEDFEVYDKIMWNFGDYKAYQPWVNKMKPVDRLVLYGRKETQPKIPELEWNYPVTGIWVGRLPRTNAVPAAATSTNAPAVQ